MERVAASARAAGMDAGAPAVEATLPRVPPVPVGLVERAQQGDRDAFARIFQISVQPVSRYVGAMLRDAALTEDVVAQAYLEAWKQLPRLRNPERFSGWILRVAHNRAIDEVRRPRHSPIDDVATDAVAPRAAEPETAFLRKRDMDRVRRALLSLPDDQRQIVTLRYLMGLSHAEAAAQLGRSEDASRQLLRRATHRLRRMLEE